MEKMTAVYVLASEIDSFWRAFCGSFYGIPNVIPNISGVLSVLNVVEDPFMEKMSAVYVLAGEYKGLPLSTVSSAHSFVEMAKITFAFCAAFLAGLASAKSFHGMTVHPDTVMLGSDPDSYWSVAYDRNFAELERYTPRSTIGAHCERAQKPPRVGAMETDARNNWGSDSYNLYFGWKQGWEHVAWMCVADDIVTLGSTGDARCNTNTLHTGGTLSAPRVRVRHCHLRLHIRSTCTVTKESTLGISYTATITVGIPDVIGGSGSWTHLRRSLIRRPAADYPDERPAGSTCRLDYESKTCYEPVKGRVTFSANGWFTFGYNSPTHGHYYWYMYIDDYASRGVASYSEFTGSLNAISKSHYNGHSVPVTYLFADLSDRLGKTGFLP
ncbi:hypothetical protein B0H13DRAFT_2534319 [Mycena leptocephala]|nr:hypothetical protein B0H13DRAFT_2534319 [Mycena leptocephala]